MRKNGYKNKSIKIYVHYGCEAKDFCLKKFEKVKNHPLCNKAIGGLWASPVRCFENGDSQGKSPFGWEEFCRQNEHQPRSGLISKFYFYLDDCANIVRVSEKRDCDSLPKREIDETVEYWMRGFIDFEECVRQGVDAIEYCYSAAHASGRQGEEMDQLMFGWDCDSILIMNPKIIKKKDIF